MLLLLLQIPENKIVTLWPEHCDPRELIKDIFILEKKFI